MREGNENDVLKALNESIKLLQKVHVSTTVTNDTKKIEDDLDLIEEWRSKNYKNYVDWDKVEIKD